MIRPKKHDQWQIAWGSYDEDECGAELLEYQDDYDVQVITCDDANQKTLNDTVNVLNKDDPDVKHWKLLGSIIMQKRYTSNEVGIKLKGKDDNEEKE
ncbi:MAG: hypothetical protein IIC61_05760 [Proteobacteria bacterium]|nr:hypothetical protein [Pseudomonadota bacterium]